MDKKQKFVITINRELGSGGRTVGMKLAEKLNVAFYDKLLIRELEKKFNLSVDEIEKMKADKHQWWTEFKKVFAANAQNANELWYYQMMTTGPEMDFVTTDDMFEAEKEILRNIAAEESCVIAGRSGFFVFANHPNRLSILIQAPMKYRIERIMKKQDLNEKDAEKAIKKVDDMRETYVKKYTGTSRYDTRNYDLVINMEGKTEDEVVELILSYIG